MQSFASKLRYKLASLKFQSRILLTDYCGNLRSFLIFVGNNRAGTTLVKSLLDAHPNVILGHEVHILKCIAEGVSWTQGVSKILASSEQFARKPFWTGYSYQIPTLSNQIHTLHIIGDKKAYLTTNLLAQDMSLLDRLIQWSPVPIIAIHCVRHPFDVIATKIRRNRLPSQRNIEDYFRIEKTATLVFDKLGKHQCKRIYYEQLIENPLDSLQSLLDFLELNAEHSYLSACQSVMFDRPHKSRFGIDWTPEMIGAIWRLSLEVEHLSYYLNQGKLLFNEV